MTQVKTPTTTLPIEPRVVEYPTNSEMVEYVLDTFLKAMMHVQSRSQETATKLSAFNETIVPSYNVSTIFSPATLAMLTTELFAVEDMSNIIGDVMTSFKLLLGSEYRFSDAIDWISAAYSFVEVKPSDSLLPATIPEHVREAMYPTMDHVVKTLSSNPHIVYFVLLSLVS